MKIGGYVVPARATAEPDPSCREPVPNAARAARRGSSGLGACRDSCRGAAHALA